MPNLRWYLNRLAAMSLPELAYRVRQRVRREQERRAAPPPPPPVDGAAGLARLRELAPTLIPALTDPAGLAERHAAYFPEGRAACLRAADAIRAGTVSILGRDLAVGPLPDWHRDPLTGRKWPRRFWGDIDIRDGATVGGVKWVWELNRHHQLVTLAKAHRLTGDDGYAEAVCAQIAGWIAQNPYGVGVNWTSALELALRAINWIYALALISDAAALTAERFAAFQAAIDAQAGSIARHMSAFSSANNHLVGEAAGLALVGLMLPQLPRADRWRRLGLRVLADELPRQIHPDGVPAEQAPHYLSFVLDFNLLAWATAERQGDPPPPVWAERLGAAATFLAHILDAHGHPPALGDSDDAWVLRLDDTALAGWPYGRTRVSALWAPQNQGGEPLAPVRSPPAAARDPLPNPVPTREVGRLSPQDAESPPSPLEGEGGQGEAGSGTAELSLLASAAAILGDPQLKLAAGGWDEKSDWLLGERGRVAFAALGPAEPPGPRLFAQGGYAVMRHEQRVAVLDCGPLGYLATAAHGHADALSLTLSTAHGPLLVDPGTYAYHEAPAWRRYLRGTAAHNTVLVDNLDQSEIQGTFLWGRRASVTIRSWRSDERRDQICAEHDGYRARGLIHRRAVTFLKPDWVVVRDDLLEAEGNRPRGQGAKGPRGSRTIHAAQLWHLPPGAEARVAEGGVVGRAGEQPFAILALEWPAMWASVVCGQDQPPQGWHAPRYGVLLPAPAVIIAGTGPLPRAIVTAIYLGADEPLAALAQASDILACAQVEP